MNLRNYLFLSLSFLFFSCGGEKNQAKTSSAQAPQEASPAEIQIGLPRANFLLNLMDIYLDNKDSKLESGKDEEIRDLIKKIKLEINKREINKETISAFVSQLNGYKGNILFEITNFLEEKKNGVVKSNDLWIIEQNMLANFLRIYTCLGDPSNLSYEGFPKKEYLKEIIKKFENIIENYSDLNLNSLSRHISYYTLEDKCQDLLNIYYKINAFCETIERLKKRIEEISYNELPKSEVVSKCFKSMFSQWPYKSLIKHMNILIDLFFDGRKYKDQEIDSICKAYHLNINHSVPLGYDDGFNNFFIKKKQKWFDEIIDELIENLSKI